MTYSVQQLISEIQNDLGNIISKKYGQIILKGKVSEINFVEYKGYNYGKIEAEETGSNIQFKVPSALLPKLRLKVKYDLVGILYINYYKKSGSLTPLLVVSEVNESDRKEIFEGNKNLQQVAREIFSKDKFDVDAYLRDKSRVRLSVITGKNSKAKVDFESQLGWNHNYYSIYYKPINIESAYEVAKSIEDSQRDSDLIAITRGGGESLKFLDDEKIFEAIRASKIPVISAVGHFSDEMLINHVTDLSLGTPSALGTYLKEHAMIMDKKLNYQNHSEKIPYSYSYQNFQNSRKETQYSNSYKKRGGCLNFILISVGVFAIIFQMLY